MTKKRPCAIFFGTSAFAVPVLKALSLMADVHLVITRPNAPAGRGKKLRPSTVRLKAESLGLTVLTPKRVKDTDFYHTIRDVQPDIAIISAYGKILPPELLPTPTKGFLNVHPSLLPRHRGPSPISGAILAGDAVTGVSLIVLDSEMDHGPIMAQQSIPIEPHEHRPSLEQRLAQLSADLLSSTLIPFLDGSIQSRPQSHEQATYTNLLTRHDAVINWEADATQIERQIRAYDPWPGTVTTFQRQPLKIFDGWAVNHSVKAASGSVIEYGGQPGIVCGQGILTKLIIQQPGGKPLDASSFVRGHRRFIGSQLGNN